MSWDAWHLFRCLRFLWYFWPSGIWTVYDLGVWCLLITVAGTKLFPCCNVTFSPLLRGGRYHCVYHNQLSLSAFFSESVPWLLGLHVSLQGLRVLVKMFSICSPWTIVQAISLFFLIVCSCSSAEPCMNLVLSMVFTARSACPLAWRYLGLEVVCTKP